MKLRSGRIVGARAPTPRRRRRSAPARARTAAVTQVARRVARQEIRRNTELKCLFKDHDGTNSIPASLNVEAIVMRGSQQGDLVGNRAGSEVILKHINMRVTIQNPNGDADGWVRFIVVRRKKPEYNFTRLFQAQASNVDGEDYSSNMLRITQPLNTRLYTPILDKKIRILRTGGGQQGRSIALKKYRLRINKKMSFETVEDNFNIMPNYGIVAIVQWDDASTTRGMNINFSMWQYFTDS